MVILLIELIILILCLIYLILIFSNLEINVNTFKAEASKKIKYKDILIYIKLKLFNKITFFKIKLDSKRIEKIKKSKIKDNKLLNKIIFTQKENVKLNKLEILKQLNFKLEEIDLKVIISLLEVLPTILAIPILSTIISIIIEKTAKKYEKEKYKYSVTPTYNLNLMVKMELKCIISIKIVHIIEVIYMMLKKEVEKNDERTSNRRTYVCSYDKYRRHGRC